MKVHVEFTGQLKTAIRRASDQLDLPEGATVEILLRWLGERYSEEAKPHLLDTSNELQASLLVAMNGTAFPSRQAASSVLQEGDVVVLLPPIAGG